MFHVLATALVASLALLLVGAAGMLTAALGSPIPLAVVGVLVAIPIAWVIGPVGIFWLRGWRTEGHMEAMMERLSERENRWAFVFRSRAQVNFELACGSIWSVEAKANLLADRHRYATWFGSDLENLIEAIGPGFSSEHLDLIIRNDVTDISKLIGYIEVAEVEAAVYALAEDVPIEYAEALFVTA